MNAYICGTTNRCFSLSLLHSLFKINTFLKMLLNLKANEWVPERHRPPTENKNECEGPWYVHESEKIQSFLLVSKGSMTPKRLRTSQVGDLDSESTQ